MAFNWPNCSSVCQNLVALIKTLKQFKEADATAQGLLQRMNNTMFVGTMLLVNTAFPHRNTVSELFRKYNRCHTSIRPALQSTKLRISEIQSSFNLVPELQTAIQPGGDYASLEMSLKMKVR